MRTLKQLSKRLAATTMALGAGTVLAACGDNLDSGDDDPDRPDAQVDMATMPDMEVDMAQPVATRGGTIAVTDVAVTTPAAAGVGGIRGGAISISFSDLTMNGGEVVAGTSPISSCVVTKFDADSLPNPTLDAGAITISGDGLLKTVGPCTRQAAFGNQYVCISATGADQTITALNPGDPVPAGVILYTLTEQAATVGVQSLVGSYLVVNGFAGGNAAFSSGMSAFPVVGQMSNTLNVINAAAEGAGLTTDTIDNGTFTVLNGFAPVPGAGAGADFLSVAQTETDPPVNRGVRVQKDDDENWPEIDFTAYPRGEGLDLDDASALLHALPTSTAADLVFSCAGAGGNCGSEAEQVGGLEAMILSGRATKKSLAGLAPFQMPTEVPGTDEWLEFQCAWIFNDTATLTEAAVQAIIDFEPTRVEARLLRVSGAILPEPDNIRNEARVLVGHGLVGHTTFPVKN